MSAQMIKLDRSNWILANTFFGIQSVWVVLGIICNFILFLTTLKTRTMRTTCNILIAICAMSDIFHELGTLAQFPFIWNSDLEVSSDICDCIMFLPGMGIAVGCACILCIGVDRMISVIWSTRYRSFNKVYYNTVHGALIIVYSMSVASLIFLYYDQRMVSCELLTPYFNDGIQWLVNVTLIINATSAIVYFVTWIGLRRQANSDVMKRIVKSLFIIVSVDVSGWLITPGMYKIFLTLNMNEQQLFAWGYFSRIFIHIALASKLFIYYTTSSDYRAAINQVIFKKTPQTKVASRATTSVY